MSSKRRKTSHSEGGLKDASAPTLKDDVKSKKTEEERLSPQPKQPPAPSSEAESETIGSGSKQGNNDTAPKTFADLVRIIRFTVL